MIYQPGFSPYQVMTDPELAGPWFEDPSHDPWKVFVKSISGEPMTVGEKEFYRQMTNRQEPPVGGSRFPCGVVGRRGGKSEHAGFLLTHSACFVDYSPWLAPGEVATGMMLAADRQQAKNIMQYVTGFFEQIPLLGNMVDRIYKEGIVLNNRTRIEIHTCDFQSVRGYTLFAVVADELAHWPQDATATLRALRPGLLTIPSSWMLLLSSPYGQSGPLWEIYSKHYGKENSKTLVWQAGTLDMNPSVDKQMIADEYAADPIGSDAEYGAQFRRDVTRFISPEVVNGSYEPGVTERPYEDRYSCVLFLDSASGVVNGDLMAYSIVTLIDDKPVLLYLKAHNPPFSPSQVVKDCVEVARRYHVTKVVGDRFASGFVHDEFRESGIEYETTSMTKSELFIDLLNALNSGKVELLDDEVLIDQLLSLERKQGAGRDKIEARRPLHDDLANAVAGAVYLSKQGTDLFLLGGFGDITQTPKSLQYAAEEDDKVQRSRRKERERRGHGGNIFDQSLGRKLY